MVENIDSLNYCRCEGRPPVSLPQVFCGRPPWNNWIAVCPP